MNNRPRFNKSNTSPHQTAIACALVLSMAFGSTPAFAYDASSAEGDCLRKVMNGDGGYRRAHETKTETTGRNMYKVEGLVQDQNDRNHRFMCRIESREVVSWKVDSDVVDGGQSSDSSKALAIGAGVLAIAAVAGIVAANRKKDKERDREDEQRRDYDEGRGQALDDMDYLKRECAREVRFHLERDHGNVRDLDLRYPNLNGRTLTGQGRVAFDQGGHRDLTYTCDFDRRGRIHDGHYSYRSNW